MIAELALDVHRKTGTINDLERRNSYQLRQIYTTEQRLRDWDQRIRQLLGPYTSAAINDTTFRVDRNRVRQMQVFPSLDLNYSNAVSPMDEAVVGYVEDILYLIGSLERSDRTQLSRRMYFDIDGPGPRREAVCGMTEYYFQDLMRDGDRGIEILAKIISKQIAKILLNEKRERQTA